MHSVLDPPRLRRAASRYRSKIQGSIDRPLRRLRYALCQQYLRNPPSAHRLHSHPPTLTEIQRDTIAELRRRGIAFVSQERLGVSPKDWADLRRLVLEFAGTDRVRDRIRDFPEIARQRKLVGDDYMVKLCPENPILETDHPLLRVGLVSPLLDIVNGYLGMWAKLSYTDAWHTIPVDIGRRIGSQSWHRDPEDRRMIKAYLYCADVDQGAGPMEYIPESAAGERYGQYWAWKPLGTHAERYPSDDEISARLPGAERVLCTGREGTFVLCDTDGLHRGGVSISSPRILATWTFVTPAALGSTVHRRFRLAGSAEALTRSPAALFALR
jgi:hypothetical protein